MTWVGLSCLLDSIVISLHFPFFGWDGDLISLELDADAYLILGCIIPNLGSDLLQRTTTCKLIPEVTSYGLIVLNAWDVPGKVIWGWVYIHISPFPVILGKEILVVCHFLHAYWLSSNHLSFQIMFNPSKCVAVLQIELKLYDPKGSKTSELVSCAEDFCSDTYDGPIAGCKPDVACPYSVTYGDGSSTTGYFVKDYLSFNQVNGNFHSSPANSTVIFGWEPEKYFPCNTMMSSDNCLLLDLILASDSGIYVLCQWFLS